MTSAMGTNKVFILDKYFNELQEFWDTEKRLHGKLVTQLRVHCTAVWGS